MSIVKLLKKSLYILIVLVLIAPVALSACQPKAEEEGPGVVEGSALDAAMAGEYSGTVVTMAGPFTDADEVIFNETMAAFEEATGIDIQYEGSKEFKASI